MVQDGRLYEGKTHSSGVALSSNIPIARRRKQFGWTHLWPVVLPYALANKPTWPNQQTPLDPTRMDRVKLACEFTGTGTQCFLPQPDCWQKGLHLPSKRLQSFKTANLFTLRMKRERKEETMEKDLSVQRRKVESS